MKKESELHHRRSIRLSDYDYCQPGAYFITMVCLERSLLFGKVTGGEVHLNTCGAFAQSLWMAIPSHFSNAEIDTFVVMPNHVHGIIILNDSKVGARHAVPQRNNAFQWDNLLQQPQNGFERFGKPVSGSIPTIIRSYKSAVTNQINKLTNSPGNQVWQRNFYEHAIRDDNDFNRIGEYILVNPLNWEKDEENTSLS